MVKKIMKNVTKLIIGGLVIFSGCMHSAEINAMNIEPIAVEIPCNKYDNTQSVNVSCSISKTGIMTVKSETIGKLGKTSKISETMSIQKFNSSKKTWSTIKSWSKTEEGVLNVTLKKQYQLTCSGKYREKLVSKIWNGGNCETVTTYSTSVSN